MKVLVECFHDAALVRALGVSLQDLGHESGKGNVLRRLAKWDGYATGIVDADPGKQNSNPREMAKYEAREDACGLKLMEHHDDQQKRLVIIDPTLEGWLLSRAKACGIQPGDYGLPASGREMHKNPRRDRDSGFRRFLAELAGKDEGMKTFQRWLAGAEC